ncbi:MAG: GTPase ObgE, partial [Magnetococcales bacterium]|nr:GTPase ObgE [Magnetococcales bacterium]
PDGGDGGRGGDVVFEVDAHLNTLIDFRYQQHIKASRGTHGMGKCRTGRSGEPVVVRVPAGTIVRDDADGRILWDLCTPGEKVVVAKGGDGGRGNVHFKSSTNRAPRQCESGWPGEERWLRLEMKILADVGLVGLPNAGKSTLISRISAAKPKIADYPFTTVVPNLGMVRVGHEQSFVVADIPGLIEGASDGHGLGHRFLKHVERCALLVHLVDAKPMDGSDPLESIRVIEQELHSYSETLALKSKILIFNKCDLLQHEERDALQQRFLEQMGDGSTDLFFISAVSGEGVDKLKGALAQHVATSRSEEKRWGETLQDAPTQAGRVRIKEQDPDAWDDDDDDGVECIWVRG